jgi:gas vesicle protein
LREQKIMGEDTIMNRDHAIGFGIGILAGAVIGGSIALLYAPKTGKETRQMIKDKATDAVDAARDKTNEVMDTVRGAAAEASSKGKAVMDALRN